jgi:excisionase family DNA binding protein
MSPAQIRQFRADAIESRRDELLSVKEFADLVRVHPLTVYGWIRDGKLPGVRRFGHEIRIDIVLAERPTPLKYIKAHSPTALVGPPH